MRVAVPSDTPCNGCTACCRGDTIELYSEYGDDPATYQTEMGSSSRPILAKKPGTTDCVYLGDGGCTIHDRAPAMCRVFDCGKYFALLSRTERLQRVKRRPGLAEVFKQGARLNASRSAVQ